MIDRAAEISKRPNYWYSDQLTHKDAVAGYFPLGEEIWNQTSGKLDAFVQAGGRLTRFTELRRLYGNAIDRFM